MPRYVFYSFDYEKDNNRVQQVKNIGKVESQPLLNGNKWEEVKNKGDSAIERWIQDNMSGKSCLVVLVGERTAARKWVQYEIKHAWDQRKGVLGIRVHGLKNLAGETGFYGANPFDQFTVSGQRMSNIVSVFNPAGADSKEVYASISANIEKLVEAAIEIRNNFKPS